MNINNKLVVPSTTKTMHIFGTNITTTENVKTIFAYGVYSYIYQEHSIYDDTSHTFRVQDLKKFLGSPRGGKTLNLRTELEKLSQVQVIFNDTEMRLLDIEINGRFATLKSEYFHLIANRMKQEAAGGSRYVSLVDTSILKSKNASAAEITIQLCVLVERRGSSGDKTSHIAIKTLLERCRTFRQKIDGYDSVARKNMFLTRDIQRALQLLKTSTSLHEEYMDVEISVKEKITITDLREAIIIRHGGKIRKDD